ncbi:MAG: hypothetical protein Kow00121_54300 [Elainellaceae cyanobacterium]
MVSPNYDNRLTQTRIRVRIPKQYHQEPIISDLTRRYNVTVNIMAALLSVNARDDGWFDLELRGHAGQVQNALSYLNDLSLEIWHSASGQDEGW